MDSEQERKQNLYARWPLLLASAVLISAAIGIDLSTDEGYAVAAGIAALGAGALGAFIYAEGARHREWFTHKAKHDNAIENTEDQS